MANLDSEIKRILPSFYRDAIEYDDILSGLHKATSALCSELYIRLMSSVLNSSVHTSITEYVPDYRVIMIRDSGLVKSGNTWVCNISSSIKNIKTLSASLDASTLVLESGKDFRVYRPGDYDTEGISTFLSKNLPVMEFYDNPFNWRDSGTSIEGALERTTYIEDSFLLTNPVDSNPVYDILTTKESVFIKNGNKVTEHSVLMVVTAEEAESDNLLEAGIYLDIRDPAPYSGQVYVSDNPNNFGDFSLCTYLDSQEYSYEDSNMYLIARRPDIDTRGLFYNFGYLLGDYSSHTSPEYKRSVIARMMLKVLPYTESTIHTVIAFMLNIPTIIEQEELGLNIIYNADGSSRLETNDNSYTLPSDYELSDYIISNSRLINGELNPVYVGTPEFLIRFSPLAKPYLISSVKDSKYNPDWWKINGLTLPEAVMPLASTERRTIGDGLDFQNIVGTTSIEQACIGDYSIVIGEDTRKRVAFKATEDFYKRRLVIIELQDPSLAGLDENQRTLIVEAAPEDTLVVFKD